MAGAEFGTLVIQIFGRHVVFKSRDKIRLVHVDYGPITLATPTCTQRRSKTTTTNDY